MWCNDPIPTRAPANDFVDPLNGKPYKAGEFTPFYVPRPIMPQVDEKQYLSLLSFAADKGVEVTVRKVDPSTLTNHQRVTLDPSRVMPEEVRRKPILVSRDGFVLDGNHRWLANKNAGDTMTVFEFALDFEAAIALLFEFPNTYDLADKPETQLNE